MAITLRTVTDSDLDTLFVWESDPRAVQMAAFARANPSDRSAFDVGTVGSFTMEGYREVTYWISPARWGQGLASQAGVGAEVLERIYRLDR